MIKVAVLGANGQIARHVVKMLAQVPGVTLTLVARNATRLMAFAPANASLLEADVTDRQAMVQAIRGQDVVYANLAGELEAQARSILHAMEETGVRRLIFISSLGIYDEVPGPFGAFNREQIGEYLPPYRVASDLIEASGVDYTLLRPAWLSDADEIDYETTSREQPFKGTEVSRKSVAALVVRLIEQPGLYVKANLGVNKPGINGDRPSFA